MRTRALLSWVIFHISRGLVCAAAIEGRNSTRFLAPSMAVGQGCPPCDGLFSKAQRTTGGKRVQNVEIQLRGEPKSGTTMMYAWAVGALARTCEHLQATYGEESCRMDPDLTVAIPGEATLTFEPSWAAEDSSSCPCDTIDMVRISVATFGKHWLPVRATCRWHHTGGFNEDDFPCNTVAGRPVENHTDLWACMQEASCRIIDEKLQFAPLRDPRAVAVSTYFNRRKNPLFYSEYPDAPRTVNEGVLKALPSVTKWIALRHILFEGMLANRSKTFWYDDAIQDPLDWHLRWTELAGLRLPIAWLEDITSLRMEGPWVDMTTGVNVHPGGRAESLNRTWKDEVSPEIIDEMNSVLRTWLPGVLLARFDIPP
ncbi:unnamed protein product [Scytosiphon promiscuus]